MKTKRTPPILLARGSILERIGELKGADGLLSPERELCERIGVSRGTLKKAIAQLKAEGVIVSVPRRGNFITCIKRKHNIAILIGEGTGAAFVQSPKVLNGILDTLEERNCWTRMINLRDPEQIEDLYIQNALDGLIWYNPKPQMFPHIAKILKEGRIALSFPVVSDGANGERLKAFPGCYTSMDYRETGRIRADYFLKRGHRRIAYVGKWEGNNTYNAFRERLNDAGILHSPELNFASIEEISDRLPSLLAEGAFSAMVSDGGIPMLETLFLVLNGNKDSAKIDLLVDSIQELRQMLTAYPSVKISALCVAPHYEIGRAAATGLLDSLGKAKIFPPAFFPIKIEEMV